MSQYSNHADVGEGPRRVLQFHQMIDADGTEHAVRRKKGWDHYVVDPRPWAEVIADLSRRGRLQVDTIRRPGGALLRIARVRVG